jgi:predicted ester cyclase
LHACRLWAYGRGRIDRKEDAVADVERNIDVVRRLEDAYNRRDYSGLSELVRDDLVAHTPSADPTGQNHEGLTANNEGAYSAFPDKRTVIEDVFGEGDLVVARVHDTGMNTGGLPWFGVPANDAAVDFEWIQISRHDDDGKIAETWAQMEVPKLMQQLGAMPGPEGM